jgi:hypothetical protein
MSSYADDNVQQRKTIGTVSLITFRRPRPKQRLPGTQGHTWCVGSLVLPSGVTLFEGCKKRGGDEDEVYCDRNHLPFTP